jgi:hypothetical protein
MSAPVFRAYSGAAVVNPGHNDPTTANTGFGGRAYWLAGGFRTLSSREDVELVEGLEAVSYTIGRDTIGHDIETSVITSARTRARAPHRFARYLRQPGGSVAGDCA